MTASRFAVDEIVNSTEDGPVAFPQGIVGGFGQNIRASEGAGTTALVYSDARTQVFDLTAARNVTLPTANIPKGDVWEIQNKNAFLMLVQASDASTIIRCYGARVRLKALVANPVTSTDWEVDERSVILGAKETAYTPVFTTGIVTQAPTTIKWSREGEFMCVRADIKFASGTGSSGTVAGMSLPFGTVDVLEYPNGTQQALGVGANLIPGQGVFNTVVQWKGTNGPAELSFSNGWETTPAYITSLHADSLSIVNSFLGFFARIKIEEFTW